MWSRGADECVRPYTRKQCAVADAFLLLSFFGSVLVSYRVGFFAAIVLVF
jgi:hypothetical protein